MSLLLTSGRDNGPIPSRSNNAGDHKGQKSLSSRDYYPNSVFASGEDNPRMPENLVTDLVHDRIRARLKELDLSDRRASLLAGMSETYLRKLLERPRARPGGKALDGLSRVLGLSHEELLKDEPSEIIREPAARTNPALPPVPVRGTVAGSHESGAFQFDGSDIEYIERPETLADRDRVYALYVQGNSMAPQHSDGDLRFVDPSAMVRPGDTVVVTVMDPDRGLYAVLATLVRRGEQVVLGKLNPVAEIVIFSKLIHSIHKVILP